MHPTHAHILTHAQMGKRKAAEEMDKERERRVDETEHISEEEAKRRMVIANKMIDVQKELLATHAPTKVSGWGCEEVWWDTHPPSHLTPSSSILTSSTSHLLHPTPSHPPSSHPLPSHPHTLHPHIPLITITPHTANLGGAFSEGAGGGKVLHAGATAEEGRTEGGTRCHGPGTAEVRGRGGGAGGEEKGRRRGR